jgi:hypothetical protein
LNTPSTPISTAAMPLCSAQATPAITVLPVGSEAPGFGTSMRDSVLIAAFAAQPRWV